MRFPPPRPAWLLTMCISLAGCNAADRPADVAPPADMRERVDLVVEGAHVVTMDAEDTVIEGGAVAVHEGIIVAVGLIEDIRREYRAAETLAGDSRVVMPGLVNGHTHAAMSLLRGVADDLALMDWLNNYIFPAEVEFVDAEFVRVGTELACWEMIRGGTTTFVDMYYFPDTIAEVVAQCGLRALVSATVIDQSSPDADNAADSLEKGIAFVERWQDRNDRITPIFGPHAIYTLDAGQLSATRAAARRLHAPLSIHVAESPFEVEYSQENYDTTPIAMLDSIGFLDGPTIAAHVVWTADSEIPLLAAKSVGVIHNPTSNMKLASGVSPVTRLLGAGVRVGIGTDGAASNNDLDMWEEMRLTTLLEKVEEMDPQALSAADVLRMATAGGASAIGLGEVTGSIEPGKRADIIQVGFDDVHHVPTYNVVSHLVYVTDEQDVDSVVVDGRVLLRDGQFPTLDTARIAREARDLGSRLRTALEERNR